MGLFLRLSCPVLLALLLVQQVEGFQSADRGPKPDAKVAKDNMGCPGWNRFFWPQVSFWALEVWKRQQAVSLDDAESVAKLKLYAHQAAYLMCVVGFDPRKGTTWSDAVVEYFKAAANTPGLEMPLFPWSNFSQPSNISILGMTAGGSCMWWAEGMLCDLGWWALQLKGSKDYGDGLCWDQVPHRGWIFTAMGLVPQLLMPHHAPPGADQANYPEYAPCLDWSVNNTVIDALCPLGGYLPDGHSGVPHWGDGVPAGEAQSLVGECHAKLDSGKMWNVDANYSARKYGLRDLGFHFAV